MKRIILALVEVMCVSTLYSQERFTIGKLTYEVIDSNMVSVVDCHRSAREINIPSTVLLDRKYRRPVRPAPEYENRSE